MKPLIIDDEVVYPVRVICSRAIFNQLFFTQP